MSYSITLRNRRYSGALLWLLLLPGWHSVSDAASVDRYWELSPYRVQVEVSLQTSALVKQRLQAELPHFLRRRASIAMGPLWRLTVEPAPLGAARRADPKRLGRKTEEQLAETRRRFDKAFLLVVREGPLGMVVSAQEYDCLLETWGPIVTGESSDLRSLYELCFSRLTRAFTPMAQFSVIRETPNQVELRFRGSALPLVSHQAKGGNLGQIFRPVLRRTNREGQPVEGGIQPVAWTYLRVDPVKSMPTSKPTTATIHSHTARPFGLRRRGRVDQLATLVRAGQEETHLRLHARDQKDIPLGGFLVYQRNVGQKEPKLIGKTNRNGVVTIPRGETSIQIVLVQSSGQWIAKIPVVPGSDRRVEAPLLDDRKRLEAEAKLTAIREELIDIVARRNILAARTRIKIKQHDLEGARALVKTLERLPTASEFEQRRIRKQERLIQSKDRRVQARIEKLFSETRAVLAEFLTPGLVQELKGEIATATAQH